MTDEAKQRCEAGSVQWVNALRTYATNSAKDKVLDFELAFCAEYTNPPAHLLRGDGRDTVGYVVQVKNGQLQVFDGARDDVDVRVIVAYDPVALKYSLRGDGFINWMTENGPRLVQEGKFRVIGDAKLNQQLLGKIFNLLDFYSTYTL